MRQVEKVKSGRREHEKRDGLFTRTVKEMDQIKMRANFRSSSGYYSFSHYFLLSYYYFFFLDGCSFSGPGLPKRRLKIV